MNIVIYGSREVSFSVNGDTKTESQTVYFDARQTPTKVTYEILASPDKLQAYIDYIISQGEGDVIVPPEIIIINGVSSIIDEGYTYNSTKDHLEELEAWLKVMSSGGYTINFGLC
jgi:hypothetical protein